MRSRKLEFEAASNARTERALKRAQLTCLYVWRVALYVDLTMDVVVLGFLNWKRFCLRHAGLSQSPSDKMKRLDLLSGLVDVPV